MRHVPQIDLTTACSHVNTGDTLIAGGFGMTGHPVHLLNALAETDVTDLTFIGNNVGEAGLGGGRLLRNGQIHKAIGSFFTSNREAVEAAQTGKIDFELLPQGTLAEALRAGGAGLGGFYTPAAAGTPLGKDREVRVFDGQPMVFVNALKADVAFVRAWRADPCGNLQFRMTENNFNAAAATAARTVIVEVEEVVKTGQLAAEHIHVPGCYVDFLVLATLTEEDLGSSATVSGGSVAIDDARMAMAKAARAELAPGSIVNLGVGIPTIVSELINPEDDLVLHTENGMLGVGPRPTEGGAMDHPVNASKIPVTALPGASYFDSAASFAMIRGGHVDYAIMGGLQVDEQGNLANWAVPGKPLLGVGGAMDLACGARTLIVTMTHANKQGISKVVRTCDLPLTARSVVDVLITDLAVFRYKHGAESTDMVLVRLMPGVTEEQVAACTEARYSVSLET